MSDTKQELAAELIWRYVEYLREQEAAGNRETFSRAELEQLVAVMETASGVSHVIGPEETESCRAAVRARLEQVVRPAALAAVPLPVVAPPARSAGWFSRRVPAWSVAFACAASLVLAAGTVGMWHKPAQVVKRVKVPVNIDDVEPVEEREVHRLLHKMVQNELTPRQEKNLMWHMLVCPGCFDEYVSIKGQSHTAQHHAPQTASVQLASH